jgi:hypothetical protein
LLLAPAFLILQPGSSLSLQALHDQHGVHVVVFLFLIVLILLRSLLEPLLELPLQHELPQTVALLRAAVCLALELMDLPTQHVHNVPLLLLLQLLPGISLPWVRGQAVP